MQLSITSSSRLYDQHVMDVDRQAADDSPHLNATTI